MGTIISPGQGEEKKSRNEFTFHIEKQKKNKK